MKKNWEIDSRTLNFWTNLFVWRILSVRASFWKIIEQILDIFDAIREFQFVKLNRVFLNKFTGGSNFSAAGERFVKLIW